MMLAIYSVIVGIVAIACAMAVIKDEGWIFGMCGVGILAGIIIGILAAHDRIHMDLKSVGIDRIVHHSIVIDGNSVSNWNEIVWSPATTNIVGVVK